VGFSSWVLVGFILIIVGIMWLLGEISTMVMPVILAIARPRERARRSGDARRAAGWPIADITQRG
jgi:hypothetical protein